MRVKTKTILMQSLHPMGQTIPLWQRTLAGASSLEPSVKSNARFIPLEAVLNYQIAHCAATNVLSVLLCCRTSLFVLLQRSSPCCSATELTLIDFNEIRENEKQTGQKDGRI